MACGRNFYDAMEALNNYDDSMVQEELEFFIDSNKGNSTLTIHSAWKISNLRPMASEKFQNLGNLIETVLILLLLRFEYSWERNCQ